MITPMPGIVIIKKEKEEFTITHKSPTLLFKGKVIAIGKDLTTDFNAILKVKDYCDIGDTVYFLTYADNMDKAIISGETYYMVKVQDLRGKC